MNYDLHMGRRVRRTKLSPSTTVLSRIQQVQVGSNICCVKRQIMAEHETFPTRNADERGDVGRPRLE